MKPQDIISAFVEGKMLPDEFEQYLYSDKGLENELSNNDDAITHYAKEYELFYFIMQKNFKSCTDLWDINDALSIFLRSKGINVTPTNLYEKQVKILLKIQPSWLDVSGDYFSFLLNKHAEKDGKNLEAAIKNDIKESFKYLSKPPKWLQSPKWPIHNHAPLLFIGQIDISNMRHDTSYVYIFYDENKNEYEIFEQSA
jgi:hypothetical protein